MLLTPIPGECFRSPVDRHEGFAALWQSLRVPDPIKNWGAARGRAGLTCDNALGKKAARVAHVELLWLLCLDQGAGCSTSKLTLRGEADPDQGIPQHDGIIPGVLHVDQCYCAFTNNTHRDQGQSPLPHLQTGVTDA